MDKCFACMESGQCAIKDAYEEDNCPCIECLLKPMCKTACIEWDKLHDKFYTDSEAWRDQ